MAAIRDRTKGSNYDCPPEDEPLSVAQQQLQHLLKKQLSTRKVTTLKHALEQGHEFAPAVLYKPLATEVEGLHSLEEYQEREEEHGRLDQLRELGLTPEEIRLKLSYKEDGLGPSTSKRKRVCVEPHAQQARMEALQQKISKRESLLKEPLKFAGAHHMSRHAMEVEKSLFQHFVNPLTHLTVEDSQNHVVYPSRVIPSDPSKPRSDGEDSTADTLLPLPTQVILRNRLSVAEIRVLPRFRDYRPGTPSKVLYLKNLHSSVKEDDLKAVFAAAGVSDLPSVRLMSGKMRGQAFAEFSSIAEATSVLELVNGYVMQGKPVIISYGHKK